MPTGRFVEIDETEILYSRSCHTPLMTDDLVGWMMYAICWIQANCKNRRTMEGLHKAVIALAKGAVVGSRLDNGAQYASLSISQLEKALGITRKTAIKYLNYLTLTGEYMGLKKEGVEPLLRKLQIGKANNRLPAMSIFGLGLANLISRQVGLVEENKGFLHRLIIAELV